MCLNLKNHHQVNIYETHGNQKSKTYNKHKKLKIKEHKHKTREVKVTTSCPTLHNSMDYTVYGILQARILEWLAFPFSRGSFQPRDRTQVSCIAGRFFTSWATGKALVKQIAIDIPNTNPAHVNIWGLTYCY